MAQWAGNGWLSRSPGMDLLINIDSASAAPLHRQIYDEVRRAILSGRLAKGKRVPSTREMAKMLGVSRATVTLAFEYLLSEGYFQTYKGSGTYVSKHLPDELTYVSEELAEEAHHLAEEAFEQIGSSGAFPAPETSGAFPVIEPALTPAPEGQKRRRGRKLSLYGMSLRSRDWLGFPDDEPEIQFAFGRPDLDEFPMRVWNQLMNKRCRQRKLDLLDCPTKAAGYEPLRKAISRYIARARAVICDPEQVIIVNGSQQALDLVNRVLVDPGDLVGIEEPGYIGAQKAFQAQGARLIPAYVDKNGVRVDYLKARLGKDGDKLKVLYVTPSHQYPTGVVMSLPRRLELLTWAKREGTIIVEDDYDSEYRYSGKPMPALAGIDDGGTVIYVGTFSKVLLPALRLGYLVVPKDLVGVFSRAKWLADRHSSLLQQQVLADFILQGHLSKHVRRMRAIYQERRKLVIECLKGLFEDDVTIYGENAGINILLRLKTDLADDEIVARARRLGVGVVSTRQLYLQDAPSAEFLLNYGGLKEDEIVEGLSRLRAAIADKEQPLIQPA